tara:strand:+ start:2051 stop:3316 length:1266 start_codon:yes stop_codon:yes gene_type:complete
MENIKIGICGWGNVATGLFKAIQDNRNEININSGIDIEIIVIGARRDNPKCHPGNIEIERDIFKVIEHDIDVVIELIGGVETAKDLILSAIKSKKHVITANKAVIYHYGDEIFKEAYKNNVKVLFESSVCAGTPIIKLLKEELAANKISKISGMLNGTSNFILSKMEDGADFENTLSFAQEEGYAEPDPSFDIEGLDAAHKIGILSALAYGTTLPPEEFYIEGISNIDNSDFKYAMEMGYTIKHLAVAAVKKNKIELRAHPALVGLKSYLANLKGVRNGIEIDTDLLGTLHIAGSGAGQEATASGIISDIVHLANLNLNSSDKKGLKKEFDLRPFNDLTFQYYFYIEAEDIPGVMASITSIFAKKNVGIESIVQKENLDKNLVPIILITDSFLEKEHLDLLNKVLELESVNKVRSIRIEPS